MSKKQEMCWQVCPIATNFQIMEFGKLIKEDKELV